MKENEQEMNEKITKICHTAIKYLNKEFEEIILGYITETEEMPSYFEFFYKDKNNQLISLNELLWNTPSSSKEDEYFDLKDLIKELHKYCCNFGDNWQIVTIKIKKDYSFNINFEYERKEISEWLKENIENN